MTMARHFLYLLLYTFPGARVFVCRIKFSIPAPFRLCCYNYTALLRPADDYKYFAAQGAAEEEKYCNYPGAVSRSWNRTCNEFDFWVSFCLRFPFPFLRLRQKKGDCWSRRWIISGTGDEELAAVRCVHGLIYWTLFIKPARREIISRLLFYLIGGQLCPFAVREATFRSDFSSLGRSKSSSLL
jgi:hypothetical protein